MLSPNSDSTPASAAPGSTSDEKAEHFPRIAPDAVEAGPAKVIIRVSEDRLRAFIAIQPPTGLANGDLDAEYMIRRVRDSGIDTEHLDRKVLDYFVGEWNKNHIPLGERLVVESQYLPIRGDDAKIEYLVDPNLQFKPSEMGGNIDFRNLNLIKPVKKGQPIARKHPATKGAMGIDLFGQPCPAEEGGDIDLPLGSNTQISETDPLLLEAAVTGFLQQKEGLLSVNECFVVEGSVDYSTGNITYDQSAMIKGDVADGFTMNVGGALEIVGAVGEAKLFVGGDVLIKKGFVGAGHGLITAKGNVNLGFASNQVIRAHGDILLEKESFNCQIFSRKSVSVYGSLVGGLTMAFNEIYCRVAGNDLGTKTELEAGTDYILTENRKLLEDKIKELTTYLAKINLKMKAFREGYRTRKRFTSSEAKMMLELRDMQEKIQASLPDLENRKKDILEQIRVGYLREGIRIRVEKKVNPGVVIKVGGECMRIQEEVPGPRVFMYTAGRIKVI
jgi:uncharacterized protein